MRNDLLHRRIIGLIPKDVINLTDILKNNISGLGGNGSPIPVPSNNAPLLFDLPLNENTELALIDRVGGNKLELNPNLSSYGATFSWDESMQMYKFYTGTLPADSNGWLARVRVNLPSIAQNTTDHCAFGKVSTETSPYSSRYLFVASAENKGLSALILYPTNGSSSLNDYPRKPNYTYNFWSINNSKRQANVVDMNNNITYGLFTSKPSQIISEWYNTDYIYFGPIYESKLQYITFYLSDYKIYNKYITQNDIIIGSQVTVQEDIDTGTVNVTNFTISADDCAGKSTNTKIHYNIEYTVEYNGEIKNRTLSGYIDSEDFPANTSYDNTIQHNVSVKFLNKTAKTTFIQKALTH